MTVRRTLFTLLLLFIPLIQPVPGGLGGETPEEGAEIPTSISPATAQVPWEAVHELLSSFPRAFTENRGQLENDDVRFYDRGGAVWFTDDGAWFDIRDDGVGGGVALKHEYVGCNPVTPEGVARTGWNSNFFYGRDPAGWRTEVPNHMEVWYHDLWDGIDLRYYTNDDGLKYDLIVRPGADVGDIRFRYAGSGDLSIDPDGDLLVHTVAGVVRDSGLYIYQDLEGGRASVEGAFQVIDRTTVGFFVGNHRADVPLTIDPAIAFSTYVGGGSSDHGSNVETAPDGDAVISSQTTSSDFPTTPGVYDSTNSQLDAYVLRMEDDGSGPVFSTFIGGYSNDYIYDMVLDDAGNVLVTGQTMSMDYPATSGAMRVPVPLDLIVTRLNASGSSLDYSTGIGVGAGLGIALDPAGRAVVCGATDDPLFPSTSGAYRTAITGYTDALVLKVDHTGSSLLFSTFIGGTAYDTLEKIESGGDGSLSAMGWTLSADFPNTTGAFDTSHPGNRGLVMVRFDHNCSNLLYSTFLGESRTYNTYGEFDITVDGTGDIYACGYTNDPSFPVTQGAYDTSHNSGQDVFVLRLDPAGNGASDLISSTFVGGNQNECGRDIELGPDGVVWVAGITSSWNFPLTCDAHDSSYGSNGQWDVFLVMLDPMLSRLDYSTYFGGGGSDEAPETALTEAGAIYMSGSTTSSNLFTTPYPYDPSFNGGQYDAFLTKWSNESLFHFTSVSLWKGGEPATTIYAHLCEYTFRVELYDAISTFEAGTISLTLAPKTLDIKLVYDRAKGKFSKAQDVHEDILLGDSSSAYRREGDILVMDFNITLNWGRTGGYLRSAYVFAAHAWLPDAALHRKGLFNMEGRLQFLGELEVYDELGGRLSQNDIVGGGELLTFTGLTPAYRNATGLYPPSERYNVWVRDEFENFATDSPPEGKEIFLQLNASNHTDAKHDFTVDFIEACKGYGDDATAVTFALAIDADGPSFSRLQPEEEVWHRESSVLVGVTIEDAAGGFVDGGSVECSVAGDGSPGWGEWKRISSPSDVEIIVSTLMEFPDGRDNLVQWRASDTFGNGPTMSPTHRVQVDTEDVVFSHFRPGGGEVHTAHDVTVGLDISDATSGVDASSIEYCMSSDGGGRWGDWYPIPDLEDNATVPVELNLTFYNGTGNRVKFRAMDIAGNGPVESEAVTVVVDIPVPPAPKVNLVSPDDGAVVDSDTVTLSWVPEEPGPEGLSYQVYMDTLEPPAKLWAPPMEGTNLVAEGLEDGRTYHWTVIPVTAGGREGKCLDGVWSFTVRVPQPLQVYDVEVHPIDDVEALLGDTTVVNVVVANTGPRRDSFEFRLDPGALAGAAIVTGLTEVTLDPEAVFTAEISISLVEGITGIGDYPVHFSAVSLGASRAGQFVGDAEGFTVKVRAPPPKEAEGENTDGKADERGVSAFRDLTFWLIVIIVVAAVAVFIGSLAASGGGKTNEPALEVPPPTSAQGKLSVPGGGPRPAQVAHHSPAPLHPTGAVPYDPTHPFDSPGSPSVASPLPAVKTTGPLTPLPGPRPIPPHQLLPPASPPGTVEPTPPLVAAIPISAQDTISAIPPSVPSTVTMISPADP